MNPNFCFHNFQGTGNGRQIPGLTKMKSPQTFIPKELYLQSKNDLEATLPLLYIPTLNQRTAREKNILFLSSTAERRWEKKRNSHYWELETTTYLKFTAWIHTPWVTWRASSQKFNWKWPQTSHATEKQGRNKCRSSLKNTSSFQAAKNSHENNSKNNEQTAIKN